MNHEKGKRGQIRLKARRRQILDFSGLRYGNITPTDLDGLIEYQDRAFVFYEYKYQGADMSQGQKKALTRLVDCIQKSGRPSVLFLCRHEVPDCESDVTASETIVHSLYYCGKWHKGDGRTAKEYTDGFVNWVNGPFTKK